ncbi:VOC family protein [Arenibaculum sp.]|jgi:catechol 2,3-dioxygenase-like lactoylglutathione lyase family enzyme|uniref:VOC family protein n=1 Tax=Arenibaculum sp. TaxID=2865862 RepID=UPI002E1196C7|nr:VOC family protein [Arenibaculum sp.]
MTGLPPLIGIDHTLVGVADLEAARARWQRLGFTTTPRGRHIGWGTANYCIMFERDYAELLGIVDPAQFVNRLDRLLETRGEGLLGLAFGADDPDAVHAMLGPERSEPPKDLARLLELPTGTVKPAFRLVHFKPETTPGLSSFVTGHLTPGLLRRPDWLRHANGAVGIEGVTVVVDDPAALAPAYARLFGADAVREGGSRLDVRVGRHHLRFLTANRFARRYPGAPVPTGLPAPAVMTLLVENLAATAGHLAREGIETLPVTGERLVVPSAQATGVLLEFAVS